MKRIVITGVGRGLGRAWALGLSALGHQVLGCSRTDAGLGTLRQTMRGPHRLDAVDVSDDLAVSAWCASLIEDGGAPDLVINNAGIVNRNAPLWKVPRDEFDRVIDVNIKGVANVLRHTLPAMIAAGSGAIVNLSSGWGRSASQNVAPYCASKYAIEGLTAALAQELPAPLVAVALNPGIIDTDMLRLSFGDDAASYESPNAWAARAVPLVLGLTRKHNGRAMSV